MKNIVLIILITFIVCIFTWSPKRNFGQTAENNKKSNSVSSHGEESQRRRTKAISFLGIGPDDSFKEANKKASKNFSFFTAPKYYPGFNKSLGGKFVDVMHIPLSNYFLEDDLYIYYSDLGTEFNRRFQKDSESVILVKAKIPHTFANFEEITFFFSNLIDKPLAIFIEMDRKKEDAIQKILNKLNKTYCQIKKKATMSKPDHQSRKDKPYWTRHVKIGNRKVRIVNPDDLLPDHLKPSPPPIKTEFCKMWRSGNDIIFYTTIYRWPLVSLEPTLVYLFCDNISEHSKRLEKIKKEFESVKEENLERLFD